MNRFNRSLSVIAAGLVAGHCVVTATAHAAAGEYPTRPVRLLVPFAPGGGSDALARVITPKLSASMGQQWVVDNRTRCLSMGFSGMSSVCAVIVPCRCAALWNSAGL